MCADEEKRRECGRYVATALGIALRHHGVARLLVACGHRPIHAGTLVIEIVPSPLPTSLPTLDLSNSMHGVRKGALTSRDVALTSRKGTLTSLQWGL